MKPEISDFLSGSLVEMDKYIEVADVNLVTEKQIGEVQENPHDDNGKNVIATLYNILFAPDFSNKLFSIITLINSGHTYITLVQMNRTWLHYRISCRENMHFWLKRKTPKANPQKKIFFGIIASEIRTHVNKVTTGWIYCKCLEKIDPRVDPDPFFTYVRSQQ